VPPRSPQLALPFAAALAVRRFDGVAGPVTIRHSLAGPRLDLTVEARDASFHVVADVARPPSLVVEIRQPGMDEPVRDPVPTWSVGATAGWSEAFKEAAEFAAKHLTGGGGGAGGARALAAEYAARDHLRTIARALHARLDPAATLAALPFPRTVRFWIYATVLADASGRVAQLTRTCPGVLLLAFAHLVERGFGGRAGHGEAAARVLADAVDGAPLGRLLDCAVEAWAAHPFSDTPDVHARVFAGASATERRRALARQRLLVRRAAPGVWPFDLVAPTLPAFAPEDLPRHPVENARWIRVASLAAPPLARVLEDRLRDDLSRFVSRHALLLGGWTRRNPVFAAVPEDGVPVVVERLAAFCTATDRRPALSANPRALLADAARWYDRSSPARRLASLLENVRTSALGEVTSVRALAGDGEFLWRVANVPTPEAPTADAEPGLTATPIRTPEALAAEATDMQHSVARLLPELAAGDVFLYSVRVGSARLTLATRRSKAGFSILELRGAHNRRPSGQERSRVARWVGRLRPPGVARSDRDAPDADASFELR
jgi:hypothetical protein